MTQILNFDTQAKADAAAEMLWYNYIISIANNDEPVVINGQQYYLSELEQMTEMEVCALKVCGHKDKILQTQSGLTVRYVVPRERYDLPGNYFFTKPPVELMTGVTDYTELTYDSSMDPPPDIV